MPVFLQILKADIQNVFIPDSMQEGFANKTTAVRQVFVKSLIKAGGILPNSQSHFDQSSFSSCMATNNTQLNCYGSLV